LAVCLALRGVWGGGLLDVFVVNFLLFIVTRLRREEEEEEEEGGWGLQYKDEQREEGRGEIVKWEFSETGREYERRGGALAGRGTMEAAPVAARRRQGRRRRIEFNLPQIHS